MHKKTSFNTMWHVDWRGLKLITLGVGIGARVGLRTGVIRSSAICYVVRRFKIGTRWKSESEAALREKRRCIPSAYLSSGISFLGGPPQDLLRTSLLCLFSAILLGNSHLESPRRDLLLVTSLLCDLFQETQLRCFASSLGHLPWEGSFLGTVSSL